MINAVNDAYGRKKQVRGEKKKGIASGGRVRIHLAGDWTAGREEETGKENQNNDPSS